MQIIPQLNDLMVGMTGLCEVIDIPAETTPTIVSSAPQVATGTLKNGTLTINALSAGTAILTITAGSETATTTVKVTAAPSFTALTVDGSGTGNDTTVFGRQYVVNNNLLGVMDLSNSIATIINQIRILSITNQATNAANLALIIADLVLVKNVMDNISTQVVNIPEELKPTIII